SRIREARLSLETRILPRRGADMTRASRTSRLPVLRRHKRSGHAHARFNGRVVWFGNHDDPRSRDEFDAYLSRWLANGRQPLDVAQSTAPLTVDALAASYERDLEATMKPVWWEGNKARIGYAL